MVPKAPSLAYTSYSSGDGVESLSSESSIRNPWLAWCNRIDEGLSKPMFESSLPTSVEAVFSIPACFFGLIPSVMLGPIILGYLGIKTAADGDIVSNIRIQVLEAIILSCSAVFLVAWILFLRGNRWVLPNFLGRKILYVLAVPWSVGILYWVLRPDGDSSGEADLTRIRIFSLAIYSLWLWDWVLLAVLGLKKWSKRLRPCLKYSRDFIQETKSFPAIPIMLSKTQGTESFPSGDAATAAAMAIPLAYIDSSTQLDVLGWNVTASMMAAGVIVFLSCSGRVCFLAHHVLDVVVGALIAYLIHLGTLRIGLGVYDMQWWYPLFANAFIAAYAKWNAKQLLKFEPTKIKQ